MVRITGPESFVRSDIRSHKGPPVRGRLYRRRSPCHDLRISLLSSRDDLSWLLILSTSFGVTENCLSPTSSVLGSSFPSHPLSYVWRAMHDLPSVALTLSQEPDHPPRPRPSFPFKSKTNTAPSCSSCLFYFPDVLRLKVSFPT